jgi:hypothetical protein
VILGHLRRSLGFEGLIVTDAFIMSGARGEIAEAEAAVASLSAGCDLLLYPGDLAGTVRAITHAVETGVLPQERVRESLRRYDGAIARLGPGRGPSEPDHLMAATIAARLLACGLRRGPAPSFAAGIDLVIVDDDQGGWYAPGPSDLVRRALAARGIVERYGGSRVVLVFAEPRAAKGRAGFGPEARARLAEVVPGAALVVLFAHERLEAGIPEGSPVLVAWHRQPLMQEAVAEWLAARIGADQ